MTEKEHSGGKTDIKAVSEYLVRSTFEGRVNSSNVSVILAENPLGKIEIITPDGIALLPNVETLVLLRDSIDTFIERYTASSSMKVSRWHKYTQCVDMRGPDETKAAGSL